jgi:hypothetical protein
MYVAVYSNARTTVNAANEGAETYKDSFNTAFRAGAVMGFALTGLGIAVMYVTMCGYAVLYENDHWNLMFDCLSGYGLGGSSIAMFGRVGGGIYTKVGGVGSGCVWSGGDGRGEQAWWPGQTSNLRGISVPVVRFDLSCATPSAFWRNRLCICASHWWECYYAISHLEPTPSPLGC